ncbi:MAG: hypothetical protein KBA26_10615 [Candidatus Delongbacteria bacterium]|nr:hypothetical protein [Candidatus Delongbacteria bacterium]
MYRLRNSLILLTIILLPALMMADKKKDLEYLQSGLKGKTGSQRQQWHQLAKQYWFNYIINDNLGPNQEAIMNGNKISTLVYNQGSISSSAADEYGNLDIRWEGLGYGYEFGPFIGAKVRVKDRTHPDTYTEMDGNGNVKLDNNGDTLFYVHMVSDGYVSGGAEVSPDGETLWGLAPLAYSDLKNDEGKFVDYLDVNSDYIPTSDDVDKDKDGKPDSWPSSWYSQSLGAFAWPGAMQQNASNADKECFFVVDDRSNKEFSYRPFTTDTTRGGLGIEIECRFYQWNNPLAEDIMFMIYTITNKSDQDLDSVIFGMWGDPHVGGSNNYNDDLAKFQHFEHPSGNKQLDYNLVYTWDADGKSDIAGKKPGYMGYMFLESPGLGEERDRYGNLIYAGDGIDNDHDGIVDESWTNGLDDDHDWNAETDDVGVDGIPNTGDEGEGDGKPTAGDQFDILKPGEPNFEFTDLDESDMIGLTSFASPAESSEHIKDDETVYSELCAIGREDDLTDMAPGDWLFIYGAGKFPLHAGEKKRFSVALILGEDEQDLKINADAAATIFYRGYQFAKPPEKPTLTLVPGDKKVTLYWDNVSETNTFDPLSGVNDFEGYTIYRSTGYDFLDQQTVTDVYGAKFMWEPLKSHTGSSCKWDLVDSVSGISEIGYSSRGTHYYLGDETGLVHSYTDSNNVINGQTYYYALVAYDKGSVAMEVPPTECSKIISYNSTTNEFSFDINTGMAIPCSRTLGYQKPFLTNAQTENQDTERKAGMGRGDGQIKLSILDERLVENGDQYSLVFDTTGGLSYSVLTEFTTTENATAYPDKYVQLSSTNLIDGSVSVTNSNGNLTYQSGTDYSLDAIGGRFMALSTGSIPSGEVVKIAYRHAPIYQSRYLSGEEYNQPFKGVHLSVVNNTLGIDKTLSRWTKGNSNYLVESRGYNGLDRNLNHTNYEITFSDTNQVLDTAYITKDTIGCCFKVWDVEEQEYVKCIVTENPKTKDKKWNIGEKVFILWPQSKWSNPAKPQGSAELTIKAPEDSTLTPQVWQSGDVFTVIIHRPFVKDEYAFGLKGPDTDTATVKNDLDKICMVPNPYVATNELESKNELDSSQRGHRKVYFDHLPAICTIRIYTLAGEHLRTLEHNSGLDDGKEYWDLMTKDNMLVAYGLYLFHVDAPGYGTMVGKFAVIR